MIKKILHGFSLIELLISMTIIVILAIVGYPMYEQHLVIARRQQAQIELAQLASRLEEYYSLEGTFQHASETLSLTDINRNSHYKLKIDKGTESGFIISAVPNTIQAQLDKSCGTLSENEQGERFISGQGPIQKCWA